MKNFCRAKNLIGTITLGFLFPQQALSNSYRASAGYTFSTFSKTSDDGPASGSAPMGVELTAGYFFATRFSADGIFELNLETSKLSPVFTGGGVVVSYYVTGGEHKEIRTESFTAIAKPKVNIALFAGGAGKSFNFSAFDNTVGKVKKRAANNTLNGSVIGTLFGASGSMAINDQIRVNMITKFFKGLTDEKTPAITGIGFGFGTEILL